MASETLYQSRDSVDVNSNIEEDSPDDDTSQCGLSEQEECVIKDASPTSPTKKTPKEGSKKIVTTNQKTSASRCQKESSQKKDSFSPPSTKALRSPRGKHKRKIPDGTIYILPSKKRVKRGPSFIPPIPLPKTENLQPSSKIKLTR